MALGLDRRKARGWEPLPHWERKPTIGVYPWTRHSVA